MKLINVTGASLSSAILILSPAAEGLASAEVDPEVAEIVERAAAANEHLMRGDIARYREVLQVTDDFTLMDPFGGKPTGAPASDDHWNRIGRFFREGRDACFELISSYRSDRLVVLVANEHTHVAVGPLPAQQWSLRVTLVFRKDDGSWRLAHRHADPLVHRITLEQAATLTSGSDQ